MVTSYDYGKDCDLAYKGIQCLVRGKYPKCFLYIGIKGSGKGRHLENFTLLNRKVQ